MRKTLQPTLPLTVLCVLAPLAVLLSPATALAQAGGYEAGPGLAPATPRPETNAASPQTKADERSDQAAPADQDDQGSDYQTRVISYKKSPSYTQDREFTSTRLWVLDPGKFTVEQWWNAQWGASNHNSGKPNQDDHFFQTEGEMGIAPHLQVDIYANYEFNQDDHGNLQLAPGAHTGVAAELRVALGNYWNQIWANPTLYFELTSQYYNSPRAEFRLLLGGEIFTPQLLGALNLAFERNIFRDNTSGIDYEIKADYGLNYGIIKNILRVGVEGVLGFDSHGDIDANGYSQIHAVAQIGPSIIVTEPHKRIKVLASVFKGLADWDPSWLSTVIVSTTF